MSYAALPSLAAALPGWSDLPFFAEDLPGISAQLDADPRQIAPPPDLVFRALRVPPQKVRCVILGQDPYPTPGHAMGLAFSVSAGTRPLPPSLRNILREVSDDAGPRADPDLSDWADQGVLLLNTALTVPVGRIDGHRAIRWDRLTRQILAQTAMRPTAYILWGRRAQEAARAVEGDHLMIATAHPSPLSARKGFFGSRPFGRVNDWLASRGETPIDWRGKEAT